MPWLSLVLVAASCWMRLWLNLWFCLLAVIYTINLMVAPLSLLWIFCPYVLLIDPFWSSVASVGDYAKAQLFHTAGISLSRFWWDPAKLFDIFDVKDSVGILLLEQLFSSISCCLSLRSRFDSHNYNASVACAWYCRLIKKVLCLKCWLSPWTAFVVRAYYVNKDALLLTLSSLSIFCCSGIRKLTTIIA